MKVFVCTEADRWGEENSTTVKKIFLSRQDAVNWVAEGDYMFLGKYKDNNRDFDEMEVE